MIDRLAQTAIAFDVFLKTRGLIHEPQVKADLLAAMLGSQFILFAGPSGTGKSTAATALAEFFCPPERRSIITVESTWEAPYDVAGTYSSFAGYFLARPGLDELLRLDHSARVRNHNQYEITPVAVIEEANLSKIEGYLNPVMHGLSAPARETIDWVLHPIDKPVSRTASANAPKDVPPKLKLGPWPRFLGTINIDHTAIAPARKVSGRACVILLEPLKEVASAEGVDALWNTQTSATWQDGPAELLHDPRTALAGMLGSNELGRLARALDGTTDKLAQAIKTNPVSKRDEHRCLLYMSYFCEIARHMPDHKPSKRARLRTVAAENAVLHYVLPGLTAQQFSAAIDLFKGAGEPSLLRSRCRRLHSEDSRTMLGHDADFWTALS